MPIQIQIQIQIWIQLQLQLASFTSFQVASFPLRASSFSETSVRAEN